MLHRGSSLLPCLRPRPRPRGLPSRLAMARPAFSSVQTEEPRCFVAASPSTSELYYFSLGREEEKEAEEKSVPGPSVGLPCFLPPPGRCFSFVLPVEAWQSPRRRVRAARLHRDWERRLLQQKKPPPLLGSPTDVWPLLSFSPDGQALEKGFLIRDPQGGDQARRRLEALLPRHPGLLAVYEEEEGEGGPVWRWLWSLEGAAGGKKELLGRCPVLPAPEAPLHPAVPLLSRTALLGSLHEAQGVLQECIPLIPEARAVLDLVDKCPLHTEKGDFPVIVIEGLDATGKTTVTHALKDLLNAVLLRSPPPCVSQWRKVFDDEPTLIRRAFYALTNYILASEIAKASAKSPVIVDRYWHSTAAYAIATEITGKVQNLPPPHHPVYSWPKDLLRPDLVLLLTVSSEERIRRLQERGVEKTKEEAELETNSFFCQKVEESYRRMENPTCQPVDASPSREEVLKAILHLIKKQCDLL